MKKTKPLPRFPDGVTPDPATLAAGRYGTQEMVGIWGPENTMEYSLKVQGLASLVLSEIDPEMVPREHAEELARKASLEYIDPDRIRFHEADSGHDVIAINRSLGEVVSKESAAHINKGKTSADTTEPAKALQLKASLEVIAGTVENLRDILIEKAVEWIDIPHIDQSHLYDALPTVAGRPFVHYAEMLQSGLDRLKYVHDTSIVGKWGDATGNHHSAVALGIDGIALQERYCKRLGIGHMTASAQVPGLEFQADVVFALARLTETGNNIARYIALGRGDDENIFVNGSPKKKKGSSAMPHKDSKNGNPTAEEQFMSTANYMRGALMTAMSNCEMPYARNLAASSNMRILLEDSFKYTDHSFRRLANVAYWLKLDEARCVQRVERSYGAPTSQQVMTYLTDRRKVDNPMTREDAHNLMAVLATMAWNEEVPLTTVAMGNPEVSSRLSTKDIVRLTDPKQYIGQSKEIIEAVKDQCYKKQTFGG